MHINDRNPAHIRRYHTRQYGKGIGSFFKSALKSGVSAAKSVAKTAGSAIKTHGKTLVKNAVNNAKELAKDTLKEAVNQGTQIAVKHGTQLLADVASGRDIKEALKERGQEIKSDVKTAAKEGLANLKHGAKQAALNTLTDTVGMDRVQIRRPGGDQVDYQDPAEGDLMIDEQLPEDDGEMVDEQTGEGRRRRKKRSATLSHLLAGKGKRQTKRESATSGGGMYLYGTGERKSKSHQRKGEKITIVKNKQTGRGLILV